MNRYLLVIICTFMTFFATVLGSFFVFIVKKRSERFDKICLGLASGIMIAASIFSLLLPSLEDCHCFFICISFLVGGGFILVLEKLTKKMKKKISKNTIFFLAVTLHNIPDEICFYVI